MGFSGIDPDGSLWACDEQGIGSFPLRSSTLGIAHHLCWSSPHFYYVSRSMPPPGSGTQFWEGLLALRQFLWLLQDLGVTQETLCESSEARATGRHWMNARPSPVHLGAGPFIELAKLLLAPPHLSSDGLPC